MLVTSVRSRSVRSGRGMARRPRALGAQAPGALVRIARALPAPVDRYGTMVYTRVAELPATVPGWRVIPLTGVMHAAVQIVDADMELAVIDAPTFPAGLPRPT